jgi:hypothetical protein
VRIADEKAESAMRRHGTADDAAADDARRFSATPYDRGLLAPVSIEAVANELRNAWDAAKSCGELALIASGGNPIAATAAATACGGAQLKGLPVEETIQKLAHAIAQALNR